MIRREPDQPVDLERRPEIVDGAHDDLAGEDRRRRCGHSPARAPCPGGRSGATGSCARQDLIVALACEMHPRHLQLPGIDQGRFVEPAKDHQKLPRIDILDFR